MVAVDQNFAHSSRRQIPHLFLFKFSKTSWSNAFCNFCGTSEELNLWKSNFVEKYCLDFRSMTGKYCLNFRSMTGKYCLNFRSVTGKYCPNFRSLMGNHCQVAKSNDASLSKWFTNSACFSNWRMCPWIQAITPTYVCTYTCSKIKLNKKKFCDELSTLLLGKFNWIFHFCQDFKKLSPSNVEMKKINKSVLTFVPRGFQM